MSFAINCPSCHRPLTVSTAQIGFVVQCPSCGGALTVPGAAKTVVDPYQDIDDSTPKLRPVRQDFTGIYIGAGFLVLVLAAGTGFAVYMLQGKSVSGEVATQPVASIAASEKPIIRPSPKPMSVQAAAPVVQPEPPKAKTFEETWRSAEAIVPTLQPMQQEEKNEVFKLLTEAERDQAYSWMGIREEALFMAVGPLTGLGLSNWVKLESTRYAMKEDNFKKVMRAFWRQSKTEAWILDKAGYWHSVHPARRLLIVDAVVEENREILDSKTRDDILLIGGTDWLLRRQ